MELGNTRLNQIWSQVVKQLLAHPPLANNGHLDPHSIEKRQCQLWMTPCLASKEHSTVCRQAKSLGITLSMDCRRNLHFHLRLLSKLLLMKLDGFLLP